jgi:hypothetical protein
MLTGPVVLRFTGLIALVTASGCSPADGSQLLVALIIEP